MLSHPLMHTKIIEAVLESSSEQLGALRSDARTMLLFLEEMGAFRHCRDEQEVIAFTKEIINTGVRKGSFLI